MFSFSPVLSSLPLLSLEYALASEWPMRRFQADARGLFPRAIDTELGLFESFSSLDMASIP